MTINVRRLIWDSWNIDHILRHGVVPEEVIEVARGNHLVLRGKKNNRLILVGSSESGRVLEVILQNKGKREYYPVSAYDASNDIKKLYQRKTTGGDEHEKK